jgi:hypothetical protein
MTGWVIEGRFRSETTGRVRRGRLAYLTPEEARAARRPQLEGDPELVSAVGYDAWAGRRVHATPTSRDLPVDLADPWSVFLAASGRFEHRYSVEGDSGVPVVALPEGAVS